MEPTLFSVLALGFLIGVKHAFEPDHIVAVSTIVSHSGNLAQALLTGLFWGLGHTMTLFFIGTAFVLFKGEVAAVWGLGFELVVGLMLVYLGLSTVFAHRTKPVRTMDHHDGNKDRRSLFQARDQSILVGLVHGLAGSTALVLLTMTTVSSLWQAVLYMLIFAAGTLAGMLAFTAVLGIPFALSGEGGILNLHLTRITGLTSLLFGLHYIYQIGFSEGLFRLWTG